MSLWEMIDAMIAEREEIEEKRKKIKCVNYAQYKTSEEGFKKVAKLIEMRKRKPDEICASLCIMFEDGSWLERHGDKWKYYCHPVENKTKKQPRMEEILRTYVINEDDVPMEEDE